MVWFLGSGSLSGGGFSDTGSCIVPYVRTSVVEDVSLGTVKFRSYRELSDSLYLLPASDISWSHSSSFVGSGTLQR